MADNRYRLEAMLRLRFRDKKRAEVELAKSMARLQEAKKKLKTLKEEKEEIRKEKKKARGKMDARMAGGGRVGEGCVHVNFLRKLKEDEAAKEEEIERQREVVEEAQEKVAKCKRAYIEASKQLRIMEKHKDLWAKKVSQELSRREEKEMDELGQAIHSLKKWRGEKSVFEI